MNLHPHLFPTSLKNAMIKQKDKQMLQHIIFYGPPGVGKYYQACLFLEFLSPTHLKYQKRVLMKVNKLPQFYKMSDVHFEIDMSTLGCNPKIIFHDFFTHVIESSNSYLAKKQRPYVFILCKNFHEIHADLLDIFDSYMHHQENVPSNLRFILLTEHLSFIHESILCGCEIIHLARPSKATYKKCFPHLKAEKTFDHKQVRNIETIKGCDNVVDSNKHKLSYHHLTYKQNHVVHNLFELIINLTKPKHKIKLFDLRDATYDLFIYQANISEVVLYIITNLCQHEKLMHNADNRSLLFLDVYNFFHFHNNNYRPIYHIEKLLLRIVCILRDK